LPQRRFERILTTLERHGDLHTFRHTDDEMVLTRIEAMVQLDGPAERTAYLERQFALLPFDVITYLVRWLRAYERYMAAYQRLHRQRAQQQQPPPLEDEMDLERLFTEPPDQASVEDAPSSPSPSPPPAQRTPSPPPAPTRSRARPPPEPSSHGMSLRRPR
jgi:hypothetical protein